MSQLIASEVDVDVPVTHPLLPYGSPTGEPERRTAVLVVHGMGQQTTFETLADVAESIRRRIAGDVDVPARTRNVTMLSDSQPAQRLSRVELDLPDSSVHVYEAYWAPLTEGAVTLRNVMSFLFNAGVSNVKKLRFTRIIFGKRRSFGIRLGTPLTLMLALITIASLVVINTVIVSVIGVRFALQQSEWPSDHLVTDLSVPAAFASLLGITVGVMIVLGSHIKQFSGPKMMRGLTWLIWFELINLVFTLIASAITMCCVLAHHYTPQTTSLALKHFGPKILEQIATTTLKLALVVVAIGAISALMKSSGLSRILLVIATLTNVLTIAMVLRWIFKPRPELDAKEIPLLSWLWVWVLLFAVSWFARRFLVQYLGDVAVYVEPHRLDRFNALREQIKSCVFNTAEAIYRAGGEGKAPLYDRIIIMGHSLGSAVSYDVLNTLLRVDLARGGHIGVATRTKAFITFGSPLDKFAYLFGQQHSTETEEALAASIQPLLQNAAWRPAWINIFSYNDIISGSLDFYDAGGPERVVNRQDPEASTPLAAHNEYWNNSLLWNTLAEHL